jgi:hypothetical protein
MRWQIETRDEKRNRLAQWRPWFAWYPVMVDNDKVWLEWVYRRFQTHYGPIGEIYYVKEYADAMSILRKQQTMKDYDGLE